MNILVTGANGQLGNEMRSRIKSGMTISGESGMTIGGESGMTIGGESGVVTHVETSVSTGPGGHSRLERESPVRAIFTDVSDVPGVETVKLDITDMDAVRRTVAENKIDVIVNCAAYTNVDKAEDDFATADLLNNKAAGNLAVAAKEAGATLIHVSTDYVFKGDRCMPCQEDWETSPLGVYGRTKLAGEQAIAASGCNYLIFRTAWLYSIYGKNFVKTMRQLTAERDSLNVVFDQVGTPTFAGDLADVICKVIDEDMLDRQGIYHFSNEGVCSWYDFACAIRDLSGNVCDIRPCHSDEFPSKVERPHFSVLDKTKVKKTFGISVPHWYDSLRKCIELL